ncbi:TonB-dependent receptor [Pedobacter heparinus]|uniref:TonB-dependent receptor n=1 Tax=Pedobacter heparinus (strain ATCC 13125 / DSM 2366 / CIP 104194 / JCM 7457 / NBRC 12017 / NCIMB 9290 / NRRL B-14731 / HIM 762-3) TaxID=485917 RepID=C6Y245_PEDHD|nr:TonB-dependent receptor [Pedobacter heparinus]ACU03038.1 TonB-dependent receptor [Pedobacter heparinus DSM 2366]
MIKIITNCIALVLLSASLSFAQTGNIKGSVKTSDGKPAELVTVNIKGTGKTALTDKRGAYQLKGIKPGTYSLIATFIGLLKQEQTVEVRTGEATAADFILNENSDQLQEVIISSRNVNKVTASIAKMPLKNLENPQVYSSVSSEILKQQAISNYDDAMRNIPGISRTWESTGRGGDGASYFALRGFEAQPSLINGLPGLTSGNLDPASVEDIQVMKGPSGTLFGASFYGYGGIINTITKKPYDHFGGEVAYNFGSFGLNRITADINAPLSKTEKIALRVNTAYHTENSFQDAGFKKSFYIAPSLAYEVNDRLSFHVFTEILQEERAVAPVFFNSNRDTTLIFKNLKELNLNRNLSFTSNDVGIKNPRYNLQGQMLYKLSDHWTSQTVISRGNVKSDGYYTYIWDDAYLETGGANRDNYFDQYFHKEQQTTNTTDIQQNFNADFKIGNLRNRLLIGLDYYSRNVIDNGSGWAAVRQITPQSSEVELDKDGHEIDPVFLTQAVVDKALAEAGGGSHTNIKNSISSAYVSNVLNFTPSLSVMASLRMDYFDSKGDINKPKDPTDAYHQLTLSPKFGVVFQPVLDKVSVFANYMNAFFNVNPREVFDDNKVSQGVRSFKPEQANQWEFGVKANLFADKLFATFSVYDIKVSNRVYDTPITAVQGGKTGSKGFDFDLSANPFPGFNVIAGVSHSSIKVLKGNTGTPTDFYNEVGRSPGGQGPQDLANLWATYKFGYGKLKDFGIGLGGNYAGVYKVIDNSVTGVFELPGYTLINASLFYNSDKYRFTFNMNNLTNEDYYIGYWSVNPQKPRNFAASFAYKF